MNFSLQKKITSYIIIALLLIASIEIFLRILKIEYPIFQKHDEINMVDMGSVQDSNGGFFQILSRF